ncbi:unnamed protein product [Gongylonema pulchrum]|uniref:Vps16_C domain-containing protein n=1 Tax=Gongylonema pulchrum TaxID=637853 RepID=A0A183E4W9_9BILA|nr:unnamed protein product [Gongylonema pulchrum]
MYVYICVCVQITDAIRIEKRINLRLRELLNLTTATESWDGSVVDLAATLAIQFSYYFAPPSERMQNLKRCYSTLCRIMDAHPQKQCTKKYLELLQMHLKNNPCDPARALIEASAVAHQKCPTDISILKTYIDANAFGTRVVHLRKLLQSNVKDERVACCRAYGSVYLELLLHRIMLEKTEVYSAELHRLRAAVKNASESVGHRDDTFWRLLLLVENDRKDARRASEAFYLAYADFPWSKALIMDYKDVKAGEHEKLLDALAEKKLRIRCEHEEIAMLVH